VRINDGVADRKELAFPRRLGSIGPLLALLDGGDPGGLFARCAVTKALNPPTLSENALKSAAEAYSSRSVARARSLMNGTLAAANFSVDTTIGVDDEVCCEVGGAGVAVGTAAATEVGKGAGTGVDVVVALDADDGPLDPADSSSLVKYRKPPTPIAASPTDAATTGHIQFGGPEAAALAGFLTCGFA